MIKYETIYGWNIQDEIRRGRDVYALDKLACDTYRVDTCNYLKVCEMIWDETDRYFFYTINDIDETDVEPNK